MARSTGFVTLLGILICQSALANRRDLNVWFNQDILYRVSGVFSARFQHSEPLFLWSHSPKLNRAPDFAIIQNDVQMVIQSNPHLTYLRDLSTRHGVHIYLEGLTSLDLVAFIIANQKMGNGTSRQYHFSEIFPFADSDRGFQLHLKGSSHDIDNFKKELAFKVPKNFINFRFDASFEGAATQDFLISLSIPSVPESIIETLLHSRIDLMTANSVHHSAPYTRLYQLLEVLLVVSRYGLMFTVDFASWMKSFEDLRSEKLNLTPRQIESLNGIIDQIFTQAESVERTQNLLYKADQIAGLKAALKPTNNYDFGSSLEFFLDKKILPDNDLGSGIGATAAQLGIRQVTHQTSKKGYKAIRSSLYLNPNVFISRDDRATETALRGAGFYTMRGVDTEWHPDRGEYKIVFNVHPGARLGSDFYLFNNEVIIKNRKAIEFTSVSRQFYHLDYYKALLEPHDLHPMFQRFAWEIALDVLIDSKRREQLDQFVWKYLQKQESRVPEYKFLEEYFKLPISNTLSGQIVKEIGTRIFKSSQDRFGSQWGLKVLLNSQHLHLFKSEIIHYIRTPKYNGTTFLSANILPFVGSEAVKKTWIIEAFVTSPYVDDIMKFLKEGTYQDRAAVELYSLLESQIKARSHLTNLHETTISKACRQLL